jgi:hypothetical protein
VLLVELQVNGVVKELGIIGTNIMKIVKCHSSGGTEEN